MRKQPPPSGYTVDLFSDAHSPLATTPNLSWPDARRFPLNLNTEKVQDIVLPDLRRAQSPLLVSGYASLDRLIQFVASSSDGSRPRVMIGHEPHPSRRETYALSGRSLPHEVEDYWLQRGVSLHLSAGVLHVIERLKAGTVQARYLPGSTALHAKLYVGDEGATVGSSNFTESGLHLQIEANARFSASQERARYAELKQIAENFWASGQDYRDELIALLEQLLKVVSWQEALARASAELLEGEWADRYLRGNYLAGAADLWPSQRQGVAQALYVLAHQGSVLVADATGSGKTRMGVHLVGAIFDQILRKGRLRRGKAIMVCPPMVEQSWERESHMAAVPLDTYSHGKLSHSRSRRHELTLEALRRAQIMCVDEGHNFLNLKSQRTQHLLRNMADHVLLFTATPLNKSVVDLLRIADMLGADNLQPSTLRAFKKMLGVRSINRTLTAQEIEVLREEIQRFTVRRTKRVLNGLIEREPERYLSRDGKPCRFPRHKPLVYKLKEGHTDRATAQRIRDLSSRLYGATHFVKVIEMPEVLRKQGVSEQQFLKGRLSSAQKLARYIVSSSLRSSRAALVEHLVGTQAAIERLGIKRFKKRNVTGDVLGQLEKIAGSPPANKLDIELPDWLTDPKAHRLACASDVAVYREILDLVMQLSDQRERAKATHLVSLLGAHHLVLAFDGRPITLAVIRQLVCEVAERVKVIVATGDADSDRMEAIETFGLGSTRKQTIGLCSDSLSEGVNLQQASALVHLDMPTVVRIAEQRVGRVDRMDSPHEVIEAWWPEDAPEFSLSTDERFIERYETVESLLGSNMPLPDEMQRHIVPVKPQTLIEEFEKQSETTWDGIQDAFEPVRGLVEGPLALVPTTVYERYRRISARVLSRVSVVSARAPWAFFCLTGEPFGAPRWILLPSLTGAPETELGSVSEGLRARLEGETQDLAFDEKGASMLSQFLERLDEAERSLLPRRKQRALEEMRLVVAKLAEEAGAGGKQTDVDHLANLLDMLERTKADSQPDWDEVASRWLDVIRPVWFDMLTQRKRSRPLLLKDIRAELLSKREWLIERVLVEFREFPVVPGPEERVKACILGVP